LGRKSWAAFLSFVAEIKLSIFSWLSGKILAPMFHFLRLKVLFLENYFCDFSTRFSPLGIAEFVEKHMGSSSKCVPWIYSCFTSWKVDLVLWLHIFKKNHMILFFLFKQVSSLILFIAFHNKIWVFKSFHFQKENQAKVCDKLSFQSWHTRNSLYLTLA